VTQEAKETKSAPTLLVVGAGPKAVAIAAKRHMLAAIAQGPGFPNLSCLGLLADRILAAY
jgi:hypothetical protein